MLHKFFPSSSSGFLNWCVLRHEGPCSAEKGKCSPVFERRGSLRAAGVWCLPEGLVTLFELSFSPSVNPLPLHSWRQRFSGNDVCFVFSFVCVFDGGRLHISGVD